MNAPLRFELSISPEKLARALNAGLDDNRPLKWWDHVCFLEHGGRLTQHQHPHEGFMCIARGGTIRVTVEGLNYHISRDALQRSIQLLADLYPRALGAILAEGYGASGGFAEDKFVQCALFGKVRFV